MRAGVAERERLSVAVAADDERDFEQRSFAQMIAMNAIGRKRAVPEAGQQKRVCGLALWEIEFGHRHSREFWLIESLC